MMRLIVIALTIAILCTSANVFAGQVVFSNPYDVNSISLYTSHVPSYQCATDYDYDGSFSITDFHWWGAQIGDHSGFRFEIWSDNGSGLPGTNVYTESIVGDAGATATGDQVSSYDIYKYGFDLATPFSGPAGKYWFSVVGTAQGAWLWGVSGSRQSSHDLQFIGTIGGALVDNNPWENDFAFEISSGASVVPEPATMTLFGLGLLGSGLATRRSKKRTR